MSRPTTLTFDCYGTLIDWNRGILDALSGEAARQGRSADVDTILAAYHAAEPRAQTGAYRSYRDILTSLEAEIAVELGWAPPETPGYLAASLPTWAPFSDTNEALARMSAAGFELGILSNIDDDLLAATLRHLDAEFGLVVTAQQVRSYKPAPAHFERALELMGGDRDAIVHIAQSYFHDVRTATSQGVSAVWVNRLHEELPAGGPSPAAEVMDLAAAADWVEALSAGGLR